MKEQPQRECWAILIPLTFGQPVGRMMHDTLEIGRELNSDFVIHSLYISRRHATIYRKASGRVQYSIVSHAKNKLFINNRLITDSKAHPLKHTDQLWFTKPSSFNHKQAAIGYSFRIKATESDAYFMTKIQKELNILQDLEKCIKDIVTCLRCKNIMQVAIESHPCGHKYCQGCVRDILSKEQKNCQFCHRPIVSFFADPSLQILFKAYRKYRFGNQEFRPKDTTFCTEPYIIPYQQPRTVSETSPLEKPPKKTRGRKAKVKDDRSENVAFTTQIKAQGSRKTKNQTQTGSETKQIQQKKTKAKKNLSDVPAEQLMKAEEQHSNDPESQEQEIIPILPENQEVHRESFALDVSNPPTWAKCYNCSKQFLFENKFLQRKLCKVCCVPFCNEEYPPCAHYQEPLRRVDHRISCLSSKDLFSFFDEKTKVFLYKLFTKNFDAKEYSYILMYVLCQSKGSYEYRRETSIDVRMVPITQESFVCDFCWTSVGHAFVIEFMRLHRQILTSFSRSHALNVIREVQQYKSTQRNFPSISNTPTNLDSKDFKQPDNSESIMRPE